MEQVWLEAMALGLQLDLAEGYEPSAGSAETDALELTVTIRLLI